MWRAARALISCCYTTIGGAASPAEIPNNLNNINDLKFYHSIRGNLHIFTPPIFLHVHAVTDVYEVFDKKHAMECTTQGQGMVVSPMSHMRPFSNVQGARGTRQAPCAVGVRCDRQTH